MKTALITGSGGLIGSEAVRRYRGAGYNVIGVDNDMRSRFFGKEGSTVETSRALAEAYPSFGWVRADIRDAETLDALFKAKRPDMIIHTAAQPSHDWAAREPLTDFGVNAVGTLNLLEAARKHCPDSPFVHCSTSKVYGDNPNRLPLEPTGHRLDLSPGHRYYRGIDTTMSIDGCLHSLFGVSKASGDLLVQEYGRYFGMPTVCFRPGCLTGADHAGVELHGFLAYLMKCTVEGRRYRVYGYDGLQVRCNIHAVDLVAAFEAFCDNPKPGSVYNIGGGRANAVSMLEAIRLCEDIADRQLDWEYVDDARIGDHRWWISNNAAFENDYPGWRMDWSIQDILGEIHDRHAIAA